LAFTDVDEWTGQGGEKDHSLNMSDILTKIKESDKSLFVGIAGPGTGKSTAFKTIVDSDDYRGKKVLILSFINKLIDDLSADFIDNKNVDVLTLHAFAKQRLGDVDLHEDLDYIISEDFYFVFEEKIKYAKKFFDNSLTEDEENFYKERKDYYKHEKELYSFNSIIYAVNRYLSKSEDKIPSQYDLVLIDEFQDFNKAEFELIKLLNKKCKVVVVGDDDQSLYGTFRNAAPEQIRELYRDVSTEEFSLDYCYRCTKVIVDATNSIINNAKSQGFLIDRLDDKKFLYPEGRADKDLVSQKYDKIDFLSSVRGSKLIYELAKRIKDDLGEGANKRILIITPGYLKQTIYDGLIEKGFNVVEFELFADERSNKVKHKTLIKNFEILSKRKTDNLALRGILSLYLGEETLKSLIVKSKQDNKKIWYCLDQKTKTQIEYDIDIYKKVRKHKDKLTPEEITRFNELFNLKNILSRMIVGFGSISKKAIEIEMTTVMSSKGLSADFVYYVGIDDQNTLDDGRNITDQKICEFLVAITRTKEKLTLISLGDSKPKILEFIDEGYIRECKNG
jgi:superfamily I DNA/RNA helicase